MSPTRQPNGFPGGRASFAFDVLCQSIRMPKAGRSEKIGRFHRGNRTAAGMAVDSYPARQRLLTALPSGVVGGFWLMSMAGNTARATFQCPLETRTDSLTGK